MKNRNEIQTKTGRGSGFPVFLSVTLGLLSDGKMGTNVGRAERIRVAIAWQGGA